MKKAPFAEGMITSIFFLDDNQGWIATDSSVDAPSGEIIKGIYFSSDGGSTWRLQKALGGNANIKSIYFIGMDAGWAVGNELIKGKITLYESRGIILRTLDKGQNWQSVNVPPEDRLFYKIYFANTTQGWLSTERRIYRTNDGGESWNTTLDIPTISKHSIPLQIKD